MSNIPNVNPTTTSIPQPEHRIHDPSEPLPGARGGAPAVDYDPSQQRQLDQPSGFDQPQWQEGHQAKPSTGAFGERSYYDPGRDDPAASRPSQGTNFNEQRAPEPVSAAQYQSTGEMQDRPLGTQPARREGVSVGNQTTGRHDQVHTEDPSHGKPGIGDKMMGKTQKMMGKISNNPEMQTKGELRETGGKGAVSGTARHTTQ